MHKNSPTAISGFQMRVLDKWNHPLSMWVADDRNPTRGGRREQCRRESGRRDRLPHWTFTVKWLFVAMRGAKFEVMPVNATRRVTGMLA
jgi:hypothetical protein